jgi:hypothetical protein
MGTRLLVQRWPNKPPPVCTRLRSLVEVFLVDAERLVANDQDGGAAGGEATNHLDNVVLLGLGDLLAYQGWGEAGGWVRG